MRKLLSILLVAAMVLGLVGTAFAATATDVTGTTYETAVNRLNVLGILKGYTDGSFKPNNNITRAEFAAVAVRALGLEEVAKSTAGVTQFKDVAPTHWAAGYIAVAVGRGVIKGYPDGTFKPEANVTNAEAMAMLIRVLGYEPAVTGEWPMNYVSKAGEIGLSDGINLAPNTAATRGNVALLTDNSLTIGLMEQNYFGTLTSYYVSDDTLLGNKLNVTEIVGARVTNVAAYNRVDLDANEVELTYTDANDDEVTDVFTFTGVDMNALLGHKVNVWAKDGDIFYAADKTSASKIVTVSTVKSATDTSITYVNSAGNDATITIPAADPTYFYNHSSRAWTPADLTEVDTASGSHLRATVTAFLNDKGLADFVIANMSDAYTQVTEVDTETPAITSVIADGTDGNLPADLTDVTLTIVDGTGKAMGISDVKVGDVLYTYQSKDATVQYYVVDTRSTVSGEVTKVTTTGSALNKYKVYVGTTAYSLSLAPATLEDDVYSDMTTGADVDALVGQSGTFYLDAAGKIFVADVSAAADTSVYAFVKTAPFDVGTSTGVTKYMKVVSLAGTTTTLPILSTVSVAGIAAGDLVKYDLNADGVVKSLTEPAATIAGAVPATIDATNNRITQTANTFVVTADTKVFDGIAGGVPTATTWAAIENAYANAGTVTTSIWRNADFNGRADIIIITAASAGSVTTSADYVAVKYVYNDGDGKHIVVDQNGTEKDYIANDSVLDAAGAAAGRINAFTYQKVGTLSLNASDEIIDVTEVTYAETDLVLSAANGDKIDSTGGILVVGNGGAADDTYYTTDDTVVYDISDGAPVLSTWSAVKMGYTVSVVDDSGNIAVLVISDK